MSHIENKIVNFLIIFSLVELIILIAIYFIKFQPYILIYGKNNHEYIDIYLSDEELNEINYYLKYKKQRLKYKIVEITDDYILEKNTLKRNVKIAFNFENEKPIQEIYLELGEETNFWNYIYKKYMKGVTV